MKVLGLITVLLLPACGGESNDVPAPERVAVDSTVGTIEREPLTDADLGGMQMADLFLELPWTRNRINRNPKQGAPRAMLLEASVSTHETFDRVVFTFGEDAPFPGYQIDIMEAGQDVPCGETLADASSETSGHASRMDGERFLVVRQQPTRVRDDGRTTMALGTESIDLDRVQEAGVTCDQADVVTWIGALAAGTDVRVFEMKSPLRLVVDVR